MIDWDSGQTESPAMSRSMAGSRSAAFSNFTRRTTLPEPAKCCSGSGIAVALQKKQGYP
jgi:hypothetical protein